MNIEDLTLKQIREIAAMAASIPGLAPPREEPLASMVGLDVVVRSAQAGVWVGRVHDVAGYVVTLAPGARRAWYWTGAGSCSGLATTGPTGGKWPAAQYGLTTVLGVCEIIEATPEAMQAVADQPVWSGRE